MRVYVKAHVDIGVCGVQKSTFDPLKLELQIVGSHLMWVQGAELRLLLEQQILSYPITNLSVFNSSPSVAPNSIPGSLMYPPLLPQAVRVIFRGLNPFSVVVSLHLQSPHLFVFTTQ